MGRVITWTPELQEAAREVAANCTGDTAARASEIIRSARPGDTLIPAQVSFVQALRSRLEPDEGAGAQFETAWAAAWAAGDRRTS